MTQRSTIQSSFVLEHLYAASPAQVFRAFTDPAAKAVWFQGPSEWEREEQSLDFREGGREVSVGGPAGAPKHGYFATFHDIVPNERVVSTYEMFVDGVRMSVSLVTAEFRPEGSGTRLVYSEHGAFLDGLDAPAGREAGTQWLLGELDAYLASLRVAA